jgi:hypothetical protein
MDEDRHRASLAVMEEEKLANGLICEAYYFGLKRPEFLWVVYEEDTEIEINITGRLDGFRDHVDDVAYTCSLLSTLYG